jgi:hypothetical protein
MNTCGAAGLRRINARVLITRVKALPATGFHTGAPSIGTRMAAVVLTITLGAALATVTAAGVKPDAASEACRRSSDTEPTARGSAAEIDAESDAPRSGSDGKSTFTTLRSASATVRDTLSTCVLAVASTVPNVSSFAVPALSAAAERKLMASPAHRVTCGGYSRSAPPGRSRWRGQLAGGAVCAVTVAGSATRTKQAASAIRTECVEIMEADSTL